MPVEQKTMTLNLPGTEMDLLEQLCERKQISKTALIRHCLRLYAMVEQRLQAGERLFFEDKEKQKSEMILL
ncbi:MAG: hypothetical protein JNL97_17885 [Verrucomicrobiales bacterium]|nr:hypothetical protein [Verrucomicrobiales bacterium]